MTDDLSRIHYRPDLYDTDADAWAAEEDRSGAFLLAFFAALSGVFACACVAAVGFAVGVW